MTGAGGRAPGTVAFSPSRSLSEEGKLLFTGVCRCSLAASPLMLIGSLFS